MSQLSFDDAARVLATSFSRRLHLRSGEALVHGPQGERLFRIHGDRGRCHADPWGSDPVARERFRTLFAQLWTDMLLEGLVQRPGAGARSRRPWTSLVLAVVGTCAFLLALALPLWERTSPNPARGTVAPAVHAASAPRAPASEQDR